MFPIVGKMMLLHYGFQGNKGGTLLALKSCSFVSDLSKSSLPVVNCPSVFNQHFLHKFLFSFRISVFNLNKSRSFIHILKFAVLKSCIFNNNFNVASVAF